MTAREKRLIVVHRFICALLDIQRERGFWATGSKTRDSIKWFYGDVMISERALREWFKRPEIIRYQHPASSMGGRKGSRAFVADHPFPTKELQNLVLSRYRRTNPTLKQIEELLRTHNRICYVWFEEDERLRAAGYNSRNPDSADPDDVFARYKEVEIHALGTRFPDGKYLFKCLSELRHDHVSVARAKEKLNAS